MNPARHDVVNNEVPRARWARAVLAGLMGTVVFDLIGYLITGQWWDIPALLGAKLGESDHGFRWARRRAF